MLQRLLGAQLVTRPAIWGKVPAHADFVSCRMRHGEREAWEDWLSMLPVPASEQRVPVAAGLPVAFVLPLGTLEFSPRRFVVGVIARSVDRMGRPHALVVYQLAHPRWLMRQMATHAECPLDWFFWLARTVSRHAGLLEAADIRALERAIDELWRLHEPSWTQLLPAAWRPAAEPVALVPRSRALLNRLMGASSPDDLAGRLVGVRFMPWADWPERLHKRRLHARPRLAEAVDGEASARFDGAFWQQDERGGFVDAAVRLQTLWGAAP